MPAGRSGPEAGVLAEVRPRAVGSQEDVPGGRGVCGYRDEDFTLLFSGGSVGALALCVNCSSVLAARPPQEKSIFIASAEHTRESNDAALFRHDESRLPTCFGTGRREGTLPPLATFKCF